MAVLAGARLTRGESPEVDNLTLPGRELGIRDELDEKHAWLTQRAVSLLTEIKINMVQSRRFKTNSV